MTSMVLLPDWHSCLHQPNLWQEWFQRYITALLVWRWKRSIVLWQTEPTQQSLTLCGVAHIYATLEAACQVALRQTQTQVWVRLQWLKKHKKLCWWYQYYQRLLWWTCTDVIPQKLPGQPLYRCYV